MRVKCWVIRLLFVSCLLGFAGAMGSMVSGRAVAYASNIYMSTTEARYSLMNEMLTWIGFGAQVGYVVGVLWLERRGGDGYIV